jgi:hypothetical protein
MIEPAVTDRSKVDRNPVPLRHHHRLAGDKALVEGEILLRRVQVRDVGGGAAGELDRRQHRRIRH